jgi:hypothetical protein
MNGNKALITEVSHSVQLAGPSAFYHVRIQPQAPSCQEQRFPNNRTGWWLDLELSSLCNYEKIKLYSL